MQLSSLKHYREKREKRLKLGSLPDHLTALTQPYPKYDANLNEPEYLVLDFETTDFDPKINHILSIDYVNIKHSLLLENHLLLTRTIKKWGL